MVFFTGRMAETEEGRGGSDMKRDYTLQIQVIIPEMRVCRKASVFVCLRPPGASRSLPAPF